MTRNFPHSFYYTIIAIIFIVLISNSAFAQQYYSHSNISTDKQYSRFDDRNVRLGLSINPNMAWYDYQDEGYEPTPKFGFSYGLLADFGFTRNYYFSTGLLINTLSSQVNYPNDENRDLINLQYIDIPTTIKLKSNESEFGRFYGQFGLTVGFKVSGKEQVEGSSRKTDVSGDDLFRLGLQIGTGMEWRLNNNLSFLTGLSYNKGFSRAIRTGSPKISYLALNIGLFF